MAVTRKTESSTLAFLDIISCGLGAVILIFLIIKHNVDIGSEQTDDLEAQLVSLEEEAQRLSSENDRLRRLNADAEKAGQSLEDALVDAEGTLASLRQQNASLEQNNNIIEGELKEIETDIPVDRVEVKGAGTANYIVGMKVEGKRIAIILDHSTSMTHPTLDQAVVAKFDTEAVRRRAPKWQQTVRVAQWLLARLPEGSDFAVVGFADKAAFLSPGPRWSSASSRPDLAQTIRSVTRLAPSGGSNLGAGVDMVLDMQPRPTAVYIVTDGLPTQGADRCANAQSITPGCRQRLMNKVSQKWQAAFPGGTVPINTILLPMTGDPDAVSMFWGWAAPTDGLVLSPSGRWP